MLRRGVRRATRAGYKHIAKPLLFRMHPDDVHHRLVRSAKIVSHMPGMRALPRLWSHRSPRLEQELFGLTFQNPIGLSAGFDKNIDMSSVLRNVGFGFMIGGSITACPCDGNPKPWFHRLPKSRALVVHAGLPNQGVENIARRLERVPEAVFRDFPLSISVAKTNTAECADDAEAIYDYCQSLAILEQGGLCQLYEINISCPNTFGGEPFTTPARLDRLLSAVDELGLTKPVFVKMPIDVAWQEFRLLLEVIVRHNVQGVTIGNLAKDRENAALKEPIPEHIKGGLSGLPTQRLSTQLIRHTYRHYGEQLVIIGVGGVFSADDAYEKIKAGASLVALITGMIFEGPQLVGEINHGLEALLKKDKFDHISQAIGSDILKKSV